MSKIRLIPFSSLGKENGLLIGVKADELFVDGEDIKTQIQDVIIGIYDGYLDKSKKYSALIGLETLNMSEEKTLVRR